MLTGKQRAYLRGLANPEMAIIHIGKGGITSNVTQQAKDALKARELIKCQVLENSPIDTRHACDELSRLCCAEPVQVIGGKFVLYKRNREKSKISLPRSGKAEIY